MHRGNIGIGGLDKQMIVVGHQVKCGYPQVLHLFEFDHYLDEGLKVVLVKKFGFGLAAPFITRYQTSGYSIISGRYMTRRTALLFFKI